MKPDHAAHFQNIVDLDGGDEKGTCKRDSCWKIGAGVVVCYVFRGHKERCKSCDHLPECHPPADEGQRDHDRLMRKLTCGHPVAQIRLHPYKSGMVICDDCGDFWSSAYEQERQAKIKAFGKEADKEET